MTELQDIWQRWLGITVQDKKHFAGKKKCTYHIVSLVDAQEEDKLGEEERCHQVPVDGVEVGTEPAQEAQQDEGDQEKKQGHGDCGVRDDLQRQDIAVLSRAVPRQRVGDQ